VHLVFGKTAGLDKEKDKDKEKEKPDDTRGGTT